MVYSGRDLTTVRRAVGIVLVMFLLSCAVFYAVLPGFPTIGVRTAAPVTSYASPIPSARQSGSSASSASSEPSRASDPTPLATATTPGADDTIAASPGGEETIEVVAPSGSGKPFEAVRIRGKYRGGPDTLLQVQRWEGGMWLDFPVPTKTDRSGRFTAHVEFGLPGRYWVRILDPDSGVESKPFELVINK